MPTFFFLFCQPYLLGCSPSTVARLGSVPRSVSCWGKSESFYPSTSYNIYMPITIWSNHYLVKHHLMLPGESRWWSVCTSLWRGATTPTPPSSSPMFKRWLWSWSCLYWSWASWHHMTWIDMNVELLIVDISKYFFSFSQYFLSTHSPFHKMLNAIVSKIECNFSFTQSRCATRLLWWWRRWWSWWWRSWSWWSWSWWSWTWTHLFTQSRCARRLMSSTAPSASTRSRIIWLVLKDVNSNRSSINQ